MMKMVNVKGTLLSGYSFFFYCLLFIFSVGDVQAQDIEPIATLKRNGDQWDIAMDSKSLEGYGLKKDNVKDFASVILKFQKENNEPLGLNITSTQNSELVVRPSNKLLSNEISISPLALSALSREIKEHNRLERELSSLAVTSSNKGFYWSELAALAAARRPEDIQTIDPTEPKVSDDTVRELLRRPCVSGSPPCDVYPTEEDRQYAQLGNVLKESKAKSDELTSCSEARREFRKLETKLTPSKQEIEDLAELGAKFDSECLTESFDKSLLEGFAVLKSDSSVVPFCGAYRIGPTQFLTAMHCFQDMETGEVNTDLIENTGLYLAAEPARKIIIDKNKPLNVLDRSGFSDSRIQIPVMNDHLVISVVPFDGRSQEELSIRVNKPALGEPITLLGYFRYHIGFLGTAAADWPSGLRVTKPLAGDYCVVYDRSISSNGEGCSVHRCQSFRAFSGSPLIQKNSNGENEIVGVHVGDYVKRKVRDCPGPFEVASSFSKDGRQPISRTSNYASIVTLEHLVKSGVNVNGENNE